jgi:hypothetical protein
MGGLSLAENLFGHGATFTVTSTLIHREPIMSSAFDSIQAAFLALADPSRPDWADAFRFLASHPQTAQLMLDTFQETLEQMGVAPSGTDPVTGAPAYSLADVARAMGIPQADLDAAVGEVGGDPDAS